MLMEHDDGGEEILVQNKGVEVCEGYDVTTLELERDGETRIVKHFWFRAWGECDECALSDFCVEALRNHILNWALGVDECVSFLCVCVLSHLR
jgi:hypothetical protein